MKIQRRKKVDWAHERTDIELALIEAEIEKIYANSTSRIESEWLRYMRAHAKDLEKSLFDLKKAIMLNSPSEISRAKAEYQRQAQKIFMNSGEFRRMSERVSLRITEEAEKAIRKINGVLPFVYTINYNALDDVIKQSKIALDYSFTLVNENAVKRLAEAQEIPLPRKAVDAIKDMAWNAKQINAQVMQGIQNGESVPEIAKRLRNVTDMSKVASLRNARTMVNAAENMGRLDSYKKAEKDGVILKKVWYCIHDSRTRNWHLELDGVEKPVDEPWENEYGELMYPSDPMGHPANVYNCRCTMKGDVEGFKW